MAEPAVIVSQDGPVLTVTLNRPEKRNAVNSEVMCRLYDAWVRLDTDDDLRVAILTGAGTTFCAGMDLAEIGKLGGPPENEFMARVQEHPEIIYGAWLKTYRPTKPVILAAEGFARAGGTEILQGTDIRVAGESALFGVTEVQRGLFPMAGSAVRLRRQVGYAVAAEMLIAGEDLPGDTRPPIHSGSVVLNHLPLAEAAALLDETDDAFVFFADPGSDLNRGNVLYRRFDGHYGLITPAV